MSYSHALAKALVLSQVDFDWYLLSPLPLGEG